MIRKSYAKINLSLDSLYQRQDGYHEIDSIMTRISLYDLMKIEKNKLKKLRIFSNKKELEKIEDNLIYKARDLLKDGISDPGIDVYLTKNIPIAAGLGGGSSNGAEMMKALNEIWGLNLSKNKLMEKSLPLGADLPFFFLEESARARGIGEKLTTFKIKNKMNILLVNDGTEISSKFVYDRLKDYGDIDTGEIVKMLEEGDPKAIYKFRNVMEDVALEEFAHLKDIKEELLELGAEISLMSGSGASIFAVFCHKKDLDLAYEKIKDKYKYVEKVALIDD
jgi:4-diphosphocytidyl-2-C-methyl-D-erythritol kinase